MCYTSSDDIYFWSENMKIGHKVRTIRKDAGWSTEELAARASVSKSTVNDIERDSRSTTLNSLEKVCNALGVSVIDVLPAECITGKYSLTEHEKQLLELFYSMTTEQRNDLIKFLSGILK